MLLLMRLLCDVVVVVVVVVLFAGVVAYGDVVAVEYDDGAVAASVVAYQSYVCASH